MSSNKELRRAKRAAYEAKQEKKGKQKGRIASEILRNNPRQIFEIIEETNRKS